MDTWLVPPIVAPIGLVLMVFAYAVFRALA